VLHHSHCSVLLVGRISTSATSAATAPPVQFKVGATA
jgi:hypothetical protein